MELLPILLADVVIATAIAAIATTTTTTFHVEVCYLVKVF